MDIEYWYFRRWEQVAGKAVCFFYFIYLQCLYLTLKFTDFGLAHEVCTWTSAELFTFYLSSLFQIWFGFIFQLEFF